MKISSFKSSKKKSISSVIFLTLILFASSIIITIDLTQAAPMSNIHNYITGNITELECQKCHLSQEKQIKQKIDIADNLLSKDTTGIVNIGLSAQAGENYSAILAVGQTPYQLGPFYRDGFAGWSWWDTESYGTEKQKNLVSLMVIDETDGTTKPLTGLASRPIWPQALYRNMSSNYSYKADTAPSPITNQINYPDQADILMIKEVDLTGYSNANLTFWTWYEIENNYDYGYVSISYDGYTWNTLPGTLTTATDPYGNNLGNGITGTTNGNWIQETMNLTPYTGNMILLGFRFRSDINYNLEGWYVDDINVTSGGLTILSDNAETPPAIRSFSVNVTYPHLTLINITDPLNEATILQYSQGTQQVNLQEDINHPGTYAGYFYYDPFAEQYSGNYSVTFGATINGSSVSAGTQFQTTVLGCQNCHNKKDSGIETSIIHNESGYYGGSISCMFNCHSGSRGFSGGSPHINVFPLNANPMHVHEMKYGHTGGFLPNINYEQPSYNIQSHVGTTTCTQCHTSFLHDNIGSDTEKIANYTLYGTNISFSSGTHKNLTCESCHGTLDYPIIPQNQYQLQGSLGHYSPGFTSHESFTDTYIIAVNRTDNLTITVNGDTTTKLLELYTIGPVDNTTTALQGPCDGYPCDMIQGLETPIFMNITNPFMGTWIVKLIQFEGGIINYTISSNYPIQEKPIIKIPECNSCHNATGTGGGITDYEIPDWNPGFAHADIDKDGTLDIQCKMCHNAMHNITIKECKNCHKNSPKNHMISEAEYNEFTSSECLLCHGDPHKVTVGKGGCKECHSSAIGPGKMFPPVNLTIFSKHSNVNISNGIDNITNADCEICHYNITQMVKPGFTTNTLKCENCHTEGNYSAPIIKNHRPAGMNIITSAYCSICHNNSINQYAYSVNSSVAHYGTNKSLIKPTINQTALPRFGFMNSSYASAYNKECNGCHKPSNPDYGNATLITVSHTSNGTCNKCHVNVSASDLHNNTLRMPETFGCKACHTTSADKYGAPNLIGTTMGLKSVTSCEGCHGGGGNNGSLDSLSKHNIDRNENGFTGIPGRTDTVYLNNQTELTVTQGTVVTVTSSVNDTAGLASRVGGAEYYIDIDPGVGRGTPMDAADGYYDAANQAWENVTATIDTTSLSAGTHTVFVRGVDIGKQWSDTKNATLTVQSLGYINGTVTNGSAPVSGVIVSVIDASYITNPDGKYSLFVIEGTYTVNASRRPEYYDNSTSGIVVTPNNTTIRDIVLTLKPIGNITGIVRMATG